MADVPYRLPKSCVVFDNGRPQRVDYEENDHCCENFVLADGWLCALGLQSEGPIGHATAKLMRSRDLVKTALGELGRDPLVFLHPAGAGCGECEVARASAVRRHS